MKNKFLKTTAIVIFMFLGGCNKNADGQTKIINSETKTNADAVVQTKPLSQSSQKRNAASAFSVVQTKPLSQSSSDNNSIIGVWLENGKPKCEFTKDNKLCVFYENGNRGRCFEYRLNGKWIDVQLSDGFYELADDFYKLYSFENGIVYTYEREWEGDEGIKIKLFKKKTDNDNKLKQGVVFEPADNVTRTNNATKTDNDYAKVSRENYNKIRQGMTREQVIRIMGNPTSLSEGDYGFGKFEYCSWSDSYFVNDDFKLKDISVTFQNGIVINMSWTEF